MEKNLSKIKMVHTETVFEIEPWFGRKYRMIETFSIFDPVGEIKFENSDGSDISDENIVSQLEQIVENFPELPSSISEDETSNEEEICEETQS